MATAGSGQTVAIQEITPAQAHEELRDGDPILIDSREPHEYEEAHLEGGKLIPPALIAEQIAEHAPDRSRRTLVYCRSGGRSLKAAEQLAAMGYEDVASVAGGILEWQEQGLPVVSSSNLTPAQRDRYLSLIHISEPTRRTPISYAV